MWNALLQVKAKREVKKRVERQRMRLLDEMVEGHLDLDGYLNEYMDAYLDGDLEGDLADYVEDLLDEWMMDDYGEDSISFHIYRTRIAASGAIVLTLVTFDESYEQHVPIAQVTILT